MTDPRKERGAFAMIVSSLVLLVAIATGGQASQKQPLAELETPELLALYMAEDEWGARQSCRFELNRRGEEALELVRQRLGVEKDDDNRSELILTLAGFEARGVIRQLESLAVREEDSTCQWSAIYGLVWQGEKGVDALVRLLKSRHGDTVRNDVVRALCYSGHPEVGKHLIRALKRGMKEPYAAGLVTSIAENDPDLAVAQFPKLLSSASPRVLSQMVVVLVPLVEHIPGDRGGKLLSQLRGTRRTLLSTLRLSDNWDGYEAARALGALKDPTAFEPLVEALDRSRRREYLLALARIDARKAVPFFLQALEQEQDSRKYLTPVALYGLGWSGDHEHAERIAPFLESENDAVVIAAADTLATFGAVDEVPAIAKQLLECDSDGDEVSQVLLEALRKLPHRDVIYPLARLVRDDERTLQEEAAAVLAACELPEATRELVKLASRKGLSLAVRTTCVQGLAKRGGESVLECLLECAADEELHDAVLDALAASETARDHVPALIELLETARAEPASIEEDGEEKSEGCYDPEQEKNAALICDLLGAVGDPRAVPALLVEVDRCIDAMAAVRALGRMEDPDAAEVLLGLALGNHQPSLLLEASRAVLEMPPDDERVDEVRSRISRSYSRIADQCATTEASSETDTRDEDRLQALNILRLAGHPEGRHAALAALVDEEEKVGVRCAAARALAVIGPEPESSDLLIKLLGRSRGEVRVAILQVLLACEDRTVDARVLRSGRNTEDRAFALGLAIYALRCGEPRPLRALGQALELAFTIFGGYDGTLRREGRELGVWLTGGPWPSHRPFGGTARRSYWNRIERTEYVMSSIPPHWWLQRWVEENGDRLEEESVFGRTTRSGRPDEWEAYLKQYPAGRYAVEARARLSAERDE
jgi:HEAT repeat protein